MKKLKERWGDFRYFHGDTIADFIEIFIKTFVTMLLAAANIATIVVAMFCNPWFGLSIFVTLPLTFAILSVLY